MQSSPYLHLAYNIAYVEHKVWIPQDGGKISERPPRHPPISQIVPYNTHILHDPKRQTPYCSARKTSLKHPVPDTLLPPPTPIPFFSTPTCAVFISELVHRTTLPLCPLPVPRGAGRLTTRPPSDPPQARPGPPGPHSDTWPLVVTLMRSCRSCPPTCPPAPQSSGSAPAGACRCRTASACRA